MEGSRLGGGGTGRKEGQCAEGWSLCRGLSTKKGFVGPRSQHFQGRNCGLGDQARETMQNVISNPKTRSKHTCQVDKKSKTSRDVSG